MKTLKCSSANPSTCRYHGSAMRMELAYKNNDVIGYLEAKKVFEEASEEREKQSFFKRMFSAEETVEPVNIFRFKAETTLEPYKNVGEAHAVQVYGATREEAMDNLVEASINYVNDLKASGVNVDEEKYNVMVTMPSLDGREDADSVSSGGPGSLRSIISRGAESRNQNVTFFNRKLLYSKLRDGTITSEERRLYDLASSWQYPFDERDEKMVEFKASGNVVQEEPKERKTRQETADRVYELRRKINLEEAETRRKNEAVVKAREAASKQS